MRLLDVRKIECIRVCLVACMGLARMSRYKFLGVWLPGWVSEPG